MANIIADGGSVRSSVSSETNTTMAPDAGVRTLRDDARNAARQIQKFTDERNEDSPFRREHMNFFAATLQVRPPADRC
jgi:hypothetical protein